MRMRAIVLMVAVFAAGAALPAQEPVVGVKDPESLFKDPVPALNKNKQAALHIMRELLQCNQWDRAGEWLTKAYHQHNPNAASGLDGVVTFFTKVMKVKRVDKCDKLTTEIRRGDGRRRLRHRAHAAQVPGSTDARQGVLHVVVRYLAVRRWQGGRALGSRHDQRPGCALITNAPRAGVGHPTDCLESTGARSSSHNRAPGVDSSHDGAGPACARGSVPSLAATGAVRSLRVRLHMRCDVDRLLVSEGRAHPRRARTAQGALQEVHLPPLPRASRRSRSA